MKYFSKDHEWIEIVDGVATVGISGFAASELGDITYVELPSIGDEISKGDVLGVVESVKAASDVYCPISGTILEINEDLDASPEALNPDSAESSAWICRIKDVDPAEIADMMDQSAYNEMIGA